MSEETQPAQNSEVGKELKEEADRKVTPEEAQAAHDSVQRVGRPSE